MAFLVSYGPWYLWVVHSPPGHGEEERVGSISSGFAENQVDRPLKIPFCLLVFLPCLHRCIRFDPYLLFRSFCHRKSFFRERIIFRLDIYFFFQSASRFFLFYGLGRVMSSGQ